MIIVAIILIVIGVVSLFFEVNRTSKEVQTLINMQKYNEYEFFRTRQSVNDLKHL
jgi:hypothetical protein